LEGLMSLRAEDYMKKTTLLLFVFAMCVAASAQNGRSFNRSIITVSVDGLNCSTTLGGGVFPALSWTFAASEAVSSTGSGGSAGKPVLSTVNVTKRADSCSPRLFNDVVTGRRVKTVTIVQENTRSEIFTVTLSNVIISSYQIGGDQSGELPAEQISFSFSSICLADSQSGTKTCYNSATGTTL
jgi:type VI protein secretion system component Hcp